MVPIYPIKKGEGLPKRLLERSQLTQKDVTGAVNEIIANVRANGDAALVEYAAKFDRVSLTTDCALRLKRWKQPTRRLILR